MAVKAKTKPAAKKAPVKKKAPNKKPAAKATKGAAAAKKPAALLAVNSFVTFTGYSGTVDADEAVFEAGDKLYIVEVEESDDGVMYNAIPASQAAEFIENGDKNCDGGQVGTSEVKPIKGGALDTIKATSLPIKLVGKMSSLLKKAKGDNIVLAKTLFNEVNESYFYLGGAIAKILQSGEYHEDNGGDYSGEEAFQDFCQETFGFKSSKAQSLARIYTTLSSLKDFKVSMLEGIGWSKANMMERYVTDENVAEVIEVAGDYSQRELGFKLKEKFEKENTTPSGKQASRGPDIRHVSMSFRLIDDAAESVELALTECMKMNGLSSKEEALEAIVVQWAQDHVEVKTRAKKIKTASNKASKKRVTK